MCTLAQEGPIHRKSWNTALIDGDILVYRIGFAAQTKYYDLFYTPEGTEWGPVRTFNNKTDMNKFLKDQGEDAKDFYYEERTIADPIQNALHSVKVQINSILKAVGAENCKIFITGKGNYRDNTVYYKANRDRSERPLHYVAIREYLVERWEAKVVHNREADDALSITQWRDWEQCSLYWEDNNCPEQVEEDLLTIICTIDKDLKMVPGWHYNFVKKEFVYQTEADGIRWFYTQMLQGDVADNIPGYSKLTGKRVGKWSKVLEPLEIMDAPSKMYAYVFGLFADAFYEMNENEYSEEEIDEGIIKTLTETGRLLWMQRSKDDMWEPPNGA